MSAPRHIKTATCMHCGRPTVEPCKTGDEIADCDLMVDEVEQRLEQDTLFPEDAPMDELDYPWNEPGAPFQHGDY